MAVIRRDLNPPTTIAAPLDRRALDRARTPARAAFGLLLLAYSTIATVVVFDGFTAPLLAGVNLFGIDAGVLIGLVVAGIVTVGQWITNGYNRLAYLTFLAPDATLTYWFTYPMLVQLLPVELALALAALWAIVCARFGEVLLFGGVRCQRH